MPVCVFISGKWTGCLDTWSEWMSQPTPGEFWLQFPRVIGEGQFDDPTPPGWPFWRTTYLCTTSHLRMLSKWPWISRCGDYWQHVELRTDGACRIMMMMMKWTGDIMFSLILLFVKKYATSAAEIVGSITPSANLLSVFTIRCRTGKRILIICYE